MTLKGLLSTEECAWVLRMHREIVHHEAASSTYFQLPSEVHGAVTTWVPQQWPFQMALRKSALHFHQWCNTAHSDPTADADRIGHCSSTCMVTTPHISTVTSSVKGKWEGGRAEAQHRKAVPAQAIAEQGCLPMHMKGHPIALSPSHSSLSFCNRATQGTFMCMREAPSLSRVLHTCCFPVMDRRKGSLLLWRCSLAASPLLHSCGRVNAEQQSGGGLHQPPCSTWLLQMCWPDCIAAAYFVHAHLWFVSPVITRRISWESTLSHMQSPHIIY